MDTYRSGFQFRHFRDIVFVVDAVAEQVAEVTQRSFQSIGRAFLFGLLERWSLSLAILCMTIADVLCINISLPSAELTSW